MIRPLSLNPAELGAAKAAPPARADARGPDFGSVLQGTIEKQGDIRFSNHAMQRLRDRNITLSDGQLGAIRDAVDQAAARGGKESLLLMENLALVASVANRTVITAMRTGEAPAGVFTNIDSAVVVAPVAPSPDIPTNRIGPDSL
jgi:flagellar operon protein